MRTVYATALEIREAADVSAALDYVGRWISDWYRRQHINVDDFVIALATGDTEVHPAEGHRLSVKHYQAAECPDEKLIDLAWSYPDQYDKSLGWNTGLSLLRRPSGLLISVEVAVTGMTFQVAPASIKLGSPRLIRHVARLRSVSLGGHPYSLAPELISADLIEPLTATLENPARTYPIVLVSKRARDDAPLVDAIELADDLAGVAKVYELVDKWAAFRLTEEIGKQNSCYDGAVRLYWPRFSRHGDPFAHPLWMSWDLGDDGSADRSMRQVARAIFDAASFRHTEAYEIRAVRRAAERELRAANRATAMESEDTDKLLEDYYSLESKLKAAELRNDELSRECETLRANAMALASSAVWTQEFQRQGSSPNASQLAATNAPTSVSEAVKTVESSAKHLLFLAEAHETASDSPFRQPDRVQQALEAIDEVASIWVDSLNSGRSVGSLRQLFKQRGFTYADDVSQTSKGKWENEYKIVYMGKEFDIAPHITIGAKQADTCLSIHWAWDKEQKKALVAHVGRHKTNTKT